MFQIVAIIDKAFSYAIDVLLMRPDLFDDFVDNELRLFLLDVQKVRLLSYGEVGTFKGSTNGNFRLRVEPYNV